MKGNYKVIPQCVYVCVSHSLVSDSLQPLPARFLYLRHSPGKNAGVSSKSLLQGDLPDLGIEAGSPALQVNSSPSEPPRKPL